MGVAGAYFRKAFQWAGGKAKAKQVQDLWQLPLAAAVTGVVAIFFPQIMGNGRGLAEFAINSTSTKVIGVLLIGMLLKAAITVFTLKAGAYGTLAPSIGIGGSFGAILGFGYIMMVPGASVAQAAVIGATALLAASQQAPLMALFMMFEVSHLDYTALMPMGLAVSLAILTSKMILIRSNKKKRLHSELNAGVFGITLQIALTKPRIHRCPFLTKSAPDCQKSGLVKSTPSVLFGPIFPLTCWLYHEVTRCRLLRSYLREPRHRYLG